MKILGIDPGSRRTGYAVIERSGSNLVSHVYGTFVLGGGPFAERLLCLFNDLNRIIEEHQPSHFAVEGIFHAKHAGSALKLGHARGVVLLAAALHGLPIHEYAPRAVKRSVTSSGAAQKGQVQRMVKMLLKLPEEPKEDAADAAAVAICCAFELKEPGGVR